jgi:predicted permease
MTGVLQDLRYAARTLRKSPGFFITAVLTLALGLGANVVIFSFVDSVWLRPMAVPHASEVVRVYTSEVSSGLGGNGGETSYPDYLDIQAQARTLKGVAALERRGAFYDNGQLAKLVTAAVLSPNYFSVLEVKAAQGRMPSEQEMQDPHAMPVMISNAFWRREFNAAPAVTGSKLVIDGQPVLVTGVLPADFRGSTPLLVTDVWIPMPTWSRLVGDQQRLAARGARRFELYGRLATGYTVAQANAEMATIAGRLAQQYPKTNAGRVMSAIALAKAAGEWAQKVGPMLLGIAGFVLLIACANLANLLLARSEQRRHEMATRLALGASRGRIFRQLFTENAVIAACACAFALLMAGALAGVVPAMMPATALPLTISLDMNTRAMLFAGLCALGCVFLFGIAPALHTSDMRLATAVNRKAATAETGRTPLRNVLVVAQIGISLVMVVASGLLVRSVYRAYAADPGFNAHQEMLIVDIAAGGLKGSAEKAASNVKEARARIERLPGVLSSTASYRVPFGMSYGGATRKVFLPNQSGANSAGVTVHYTAVADRYFETLGTRIVRGRPISLDDFNKQAKVVVVNQEMAKEFWLGEDPIGRHVKLNAEFSEATVPEPGDYEVIGVAEDGKYNDLNEPQMPYLFVPLAANQQEEVALSIKTSTAAESLAAAVREALRSVDPTIPSIEFATMREHYSESIADHRIVARLVGALGVLGLVLAAVGLYGLMTYLVGSRTQEIGIRMALGAVPQQIFRLVVGRALWLTASGIAAGIAGALAATRAMRTLLYGVSSVDLASYAAAVVVLAAVAVGAAWLPAIRATKLDPLEALRQE